MAEEPEHDIATGYGPSAGRYARLIFDGDERGKTLVFEHCPNFGDG